MAMQFNPHTALLSGMDLGSPTTSQGGINSLLQMQQNTLGSLVDSFGNIGKTSRTNTVNDLIARGGLEGLNEAQTQARIQAEAGGTLTPEGQQVVDKLLQTVGKQDQRQFTTSERLGGEKFTGQENAIKAEALYNQNKAVAEAKKLQDDREYAFNVEKFGKDYAEKVRSNKASEGLTARGQNITAQGQVSTNVDKDGQIWKINSSGKPTPTGVYTTLPAHAGDGSGSGGNGVDKLTGELKKVWEDSTGKGKLALEEMYKTGNLQVVPIIKMDEDGKPYKAGQKMLYKGQPTTTAQLKAHLGLK